MNSIFTRKCALCRNYGHHIGNCVSPEFVEQIQHDKSIFTVLVNTRMREPDNNYPEFCHFLVEIHKTPKNLLRFLVMKFGSRTRRVNKSRLCAKYIYHLFDNYITTTGLADMIPHLAAIMHAEKKIWFKIGNGVPKTKALDEYTEEMERIAVEECLIQQMNLIRDMKSYDTTIDLEYINVNDSNKNEEDFECAICYETVPDRFRVQLGCSHSFCGTCVTKTVRSSYNNDTTACCAMCRTEYNKFIIKTEIAR